MKDYWAEGKYLDLWSLNHLLGGFLAAGWMYELGASDGLIWLITSVAFIGWEVFEWIYKIEHLTNQAMDVVTDYAGLGLFFVLAPSVGILAAVSAVFLVLEILGYLAYRARGRSFKERLEHHPMRNE